MHKINYIIWSNYGSVEECEKINKKTNGPGLTPQSGKELHILLSFLRPFQANYPYDDSDGPPGPML